MGEMSEPESDCVGERDGVLYVRGSRVPLESLVWPWREGHSAEEIRDAYATLTLAEVYGAIAFYPEHQDELEQQMAEGLSTFEAQRAAAHAAEPERYAAMHQRVLNATQPGASTL